MPKTEKKLLEAWVIICEGVEGGECVHIGDSVECYLSKDHAEDELAMIDEDECECGPHHIALFREVQ